MNEIVRHLAREHEDCLLELSDVETALCGPTARGGVRGTLKMFLRIMEKLKHHFLEERDIIFPELDKLPRKEPLKLVQLEHEDWERISSLAERNVASAVEHKDERLEHSAVQNACLTINFVKRHFSLEEEVIFPMISNLTEGQQEKILSALRNFRS